MTAPFGRTHNGILSVAAAMVDLLEAFFTGEAYSMLMLVVLRHPF